MQRIPEPELMNDFAQARAYAMADFEEPHSHFIELFKEQFPESFDDAALDLGCGSGDITVRLAEVFPQCRIYGVDGANRMLQFARNRIDHLMLHERIKLIHALLPDVDLPLKRFNTIISNSLLHHLDSPAMLWQMVNDYSQSGSRIFMMDLMRPESREQAEKMVRKYSDSEPDILKEDFFNSLLAAYRVDEVEAQLKDAGLDYLTVKAVSDRHLVIYGTRP
ncbi:MAG: class I SAM-dependent methyltransferase [Gammaproteobacteria bacterium]|nr:class I SAM-dependent methyltransferase [Gammaproteobacteria bacterium]